MTVNEILQERGARYGSFSTEAEISMTMKAILRYENPIGAVKIWRDGWSRLSPAQQSALDLIMTKIGRIINGDPNYQDSWLDIAGYATLVLNILKRKARETERLEYEMEKAKLERKNGGD